MKVRKIHKKGVELCILKKRFSSISDSEQCSDSDIRIKHSSGKIKFRSKCKQHTKIILVPLLN